MLVSVSTSKPTERTAGSYLEAFITLGASHVCAAYGVCQGAVALQVRIFTSMDLIDTKDGKKILRQYDHTLVAETWESL